jgi:hypothetical protein
MTEEGKIELSNPLASYFVEGEDEDPNTYTAIIDLYGETGERVRLLYGSSIEVDSFAEMLVRAGADLEYAEDYGIKALADKVGHADEDAELTIPDEFLE